MTKEKRNPQMSRKEILLKELNEIKAKEALDLVRKEQELLDSVKKELEAFKKLKNFKEKGKVKIEINYEVFEASLHYDNLFETNNCELEGGCYTTLKEPKGYNIAQFVSEKYFVNLCVDEKKYLAKISPKLSKFIKEHENCRKQLADKALKVGKKLGFTEEVISEIILDQL